MRSSFKAEVRVIVAAMVLLACDAHATPPASPEVPPRGGPSNARPETPVENLGSSTLEARRALARGANAEARSLAETALEGASPTEAPRLRYLAARACLAFGQPAQAVAHLEAFDAWPNHPLAPWARLERALALETLDAPTSLALATSLASVDFPGRETARRLEARLELAGGEVEVALGTMRSLAAEATGSNLAEVATPLVDALIARGDDASLREALSLQHRLYARAPRTEPGRRAEARMRELASRIRGADAALGEPTLAERIEHAEALSSGRIEEAVEAYDEALEAMPASDARRCSLMHGRARAIDRGRDRRRIATELVSLADACDEPDIRGWALFKAGRALVQLGRGDEAVAVFDRLEAQVRTSRFADDAALQSARVELGKGQTEAMRARLRALVDRYPQGDMRADAFFLLAWSLREEGNHQEALATLRRSRAAIPVEPGEENAGRAAYWEARTLAQLEKREEAIAAYEALVRAMPLTYYGLSAASRLTELDASRVQRLVEQMRASLDRPHAPPTQPSVDGDVLARATELLIVGSVDRAEAELRSLGLLGEATGDAEAWQVANLYVATDHPGEAVQLVRRRVASHRANGPEELARAKLRIGYPKAFAPLIEQAAEPLSLPPAFVRAIAREESSFNPTVVSHANAFGLIQILVSTARGYSDEVGMEPTPENLRDPRTNLAFGTRYMARLFRRYEANPALVPAAYNAGHGSVERWLRQDRARPFDEFVEEIPYEETRRYTRRVLQTYGIYSLLDEGRLPTLGAGLPPG